MRATGSCPASSSSRAAGSRPGPLHVGGRRPSSARRAGPHGPGDPPLGPAQPRPGAGGDPRDLRGDRHSPRHQGIRRAREAPAGTLGGFQERGVFPDLEGLQVVGRAITPPGRVKRFDTRFFAIDRTAIADEVEGVVGPDSELVELAWVTFAQARALDLPHITDTILSDLEDRIAAASPMNCRCRSTTARTAASCGSCCNACVIPAEAQLEPGSCKEGHSVRIHVQSAVPG